MEETIGYEALFSPEEWDSLQFGDWKGPEPQHRVTIWYPPGEAAGNESRYELECDVCHVFATADSEDEADVTARLHEVFKATETGE